ncbi:MAG: hypothetical protein BWX92_03049 [Deltaproteobacteria bacterium ADurb.Bin135]|nr:MAG: hypothetical protein BWX92_03049 [Deltaproteobacteria bacterium ADurb.Bin135]
MFLLSENDGLKWVDFADALTYVFLRTLKIFSFLKKVCVSHNGWLWFYIIYICSGCGLSLIS